MTDPVVTPHPKLTAKPAAVMNTEDIGHLPDATFPAATESPEAAEAAALHDRYQAAVRSHSTDTAALLTERLPHPGTLVERLEQLETFKAWLDSFRPLPTVVVAELRQFYTVLLTYNSNAIEGNTLTQHETEMVLSHGITVGGKTLVEHLEVIGHRDAMQYMAELAAADPPTGGTPAGRASAASTPIGEWEIRNLHSLILRPVDHATGQSEAGRYRTLDVRAAGTEYMYPPHYRVPELMQALVEWLASDETESLHPVEFAARAHYQLVTIHPFRDGNGRTARLLMNLCLLRSGYPITVITNARRAEYIDALVYGQSHNDDASRLTALVAEAAHESFIEYLRLLATAAETRGRGGRFYRDMLALSEMPELQSESDTFVRPE